MDSLVNSTKHLRKNNTRKLIVPDYYQKNKEEGRLSNSFYEATIALIFQNHTKTLQENQTTEQYPLIMLKF